MIVLQKLEKPTGEGEPAGLSLFCFKESSFDKKQEANILIRVPGDKKEVKGSLRFNYMVPVPDEH